MTTWRNPLTMTSSGFVLRLRKPKFFRANYVPYSKKLKTHSNEDAGIRFPACAGNHHPEQPEITVSFNTPIADNYSQVYPLLIHESNASVLKQLHEAGFSMSMTKKGLEVSKY